MEVNSLMNFDGWTTPCNTTPKMTQSASNFSENSLHPESPHSLLRRSLIKLIPNLLFMLFFFFKKKFSYTHTHTHTHIILFDGINQGVLFNLFIHRWLRWVLAVVCRVLDLHAACGILSHSWQILSCGLWDLVP